METNYKNKKRLLIGIFTILSILFLASLSLFSYQRAYAGKIYKNIFFDGIDLSGKSKSQAKTIIQNRLETQFESKIITKSDEKVFEAKLSETGAFINSDQLVKEAYGIGRDNNFLKTLYLLSSTVFDKKNVSSKLSFDEDVYNNYLSKASDALNISPIDASLSIKDGQVITDTGKNGVTIDATNLKDQISADFLAGSNEINIQMPTTPITPALLEENLMQAKTDAEKFLTHKVQLTISDQVYNTDIQTVSSWISFGQKNGNYAAWLNNAAIKNFINKAAAKNDIAVIDTKISAVDNSIIQQGRQGIYIDQEDALAKIVAAMNSSSASATIVLIQTTKDPQIVTVFPDEGIVAGRFPGKYIDIDLAKQLLTIFEGATQMGQYVVSSGKPSMPTPTGTRTIINKDPRAWSAKYGLWMPWWMGIGGEYGIHELPEWPGGYKEGEAHLGTPVSHGCVRLGVGSAQTVYNWAEIGIPVYIHK